MNNRAYFIVLLFAVWSLFSWHWYTCWIKGFCTVTSNPTVATQLSELSQQPVQPQEPVLEEVQTVQQEQQKQCNQYITTRIRYGINNDRSDVQRLEEFLNTYEGESLSVDGVYGVDDIAAVNRFQEKYRDAVLTPWGITQPTGYVYKTTRQKINELYCEHTQR